MDHSPGFLKMVNEARARVKEITIQELGERLKKNPKAVLVDVREGDEWREGHAVQAITLEKEYWSGTLRRPFQTRTPN